MAKSKKFYSTKIESSEPDCEACGLNKVCKSPKLKFIGKGKKNVLIIGSQPTSREDLKGELGYGDEAVFLESALEEIGIDFYEDCFYVSVVGCRPPRDRRPGTAELKACRKRLDRIIERLEPNAVVLLGEVPFNYMIAPRIKGRLTGTNYKDMMGDVIPDQELGVWIIQTWSIQELLATKTYDDTDYVSKPMYQRDPAYLLMWKNHFRSAFGLSPVVKVDYTQFCKTTQDIDTAIDWLCDILDWDKFAWDIETTGIKPYRGGHRIHSVSLSNGAISYSFPFFDDNTFKSMFKKVMLSNSKKIVHNASFEWMWSMEKLGYFPTNLYFDTMLGAHVRHSNKPTGLKYCTYAEFGVIGYDTSAENFLKADKEEVEKYGDNAINNIHKAPLDDLLLYNAMDSLFTYRLYEIQDAALSEYRHTGLRFFQESTIALTRAQHNGFHLNLPKYESVTKQLTEKIADIGNQITNSDEVKLWDGEDTFNHNSGTQLGHLLYDIMKMKPPYLTESGRPSTDAEALEKLNCPLVTLILEQRSYKKLLDTYIHQYSIEQTDGKIHAFTYLNRVGTMRSSMGSINIQNIPVRDEVAKSMIKSLVMPREGQKLIGWDAKAIEIAINGACSMDPNLLRFVNDSSKDMHLESSMKCFFLEKHEVTKVVRQCVKGFFNFRLFYGGYYKQVAPDLWRVAQENGLLPRLAEHDIKTYAQFEKHIEEVEKWLWGKQFPVQAKWRDQQWKTYQKTGYLENTTGFRIEGPMTRNFAYNCCIQGPAYHCQQYVFNHISQLIEERNMKSVLLFQIHDALYVSADPEEEAILDYYVWYYGTQKIKEDWPWLIVNLQYEKDAGEINTDWSTLKGCGYLTESGPVK